MDKASTNSLAERIARMLEADSEAGGLDSIRDGIEKINSRLDRIESKLQPSAQLQTAGIPPHPSRDQFSVVEAFADEILNDLNKEKACTFEPNGKPCDHCSMCSSRGF